MIRNPLILFILLFSLFNVGCSPKQEISECDSTKFDCTPKEEEATAKEISASELVLLEGEVVQTANLDISTEVNISRPDALSIIKPQLESLIKDEINTFVGKDYKDWNVMINSITPEQGNEGSRWIVKYDVSTGKKGMLSDECTAKTQLSSEDERPIVYTLDTDCFIELGNYI